MEEENVEQPKPDPIQKRNFERFEVLELCSKAYLFGIDQKEFSTFVDEYLK